MSPMPNLFSEEINNIKNRKEIPTKSLKVSSPFVVVKRTNGPSLIQRNE